MQESTKVILGILVPLLGTTVGAGFVFFLKNEIKASLQKAMLGFASGVMIAASVWSLIIPAIAMAEKQGGDSMGSCCNWIFAGYRLFAYIG